MVEECFYRRLTTASWRPWAVTVRVLDSMAEQESGRRTCKGLSAEFFIGGFGCSEESMCMVRGGAAAQDHLIWAMTGHRVHWGPTKPQISGAGRGWIYQSAHVGPLWSFSLLQFVYFSLQSNYNIIRPCANYLQIFTKYALFIGCYYLHIHFVFHIFFSISGHRIE